MGSRRRRRPRAWQCGCRKPLIIRECTRYCHAMRARGSIQIKTAQRGRRRRVDATASRFPRPRSRRALGRAFPQVSGSGIACYDRGPFDDPVPLARAWSPRPASPCVAPVGSPVSSLSPHRPPSAMIRRLLARLMPGKSRKAGARARLRSRRPSDPPQPALARRARRHAQAARGRLQGVRRRRRGARPAARHRAQGLRHRDRRAARAGEAAVPPRVHHRPPLPPRARARRARKRSRSRRSAPRRPATTRPTSTAGCCPTTSTARRPRTRRGATSRSTRSISIRRPRRSGITSAASPTSARGG